MSKKDININKNIWFVSDPHFGHANIIKYSNRPFKDVHEMNSIMTGLWNDRVKENDIVYCGGDFSFNTDRYIKFLNGKIVLIKGNHDKKKHDHLFHSVVDSMSLNIGEFNCYLVHRPIIAGDFYKKGFEPDLSLLDKYQHIICGHVHERWKVSGKNINIGVDMWDYKPIHIDELIRFMRSLKK